MNVTQLGQNVEAPAVDALAEAVRGLARDRSLLVKELREANHAWMGFDAWARAQAAKIEATDKRIDALLAMSRDYRRNAVPPPRWPDAGGPTPDAGGPTPEAKELLEIVELLNQGEKAEALKELRRMHGLSNAFVCMDCGDTSYQTVGFKCGKCGGRVMTKVVLDSLRSPR